MSVFSCQCDCHVCSLVVVNVVISLTIACYHLLLSINLMYSLQLALYGQANALLTFHMFFINFHILLLFYVFCAKWFTQLPIDTYMYWIYSWPMIIRQAFLPTTEVVLNYKNCWIVEYCNRSPIFQSYWCGLTFEFAKNLRYVMHNK